MRHEKIGVVLLNMGGPDTLDDIQPFLHNLFSDREIIQLGPAFLQKPLARVISRKRAPKSRGIYEQIGGKSPLLQLTSEQASALAKDLHQYGEYIVSCAMRYWPPFAEETLTQMLADGIESLIVLPLYPHYSRATTGSSLSHLRKSLQSLCPDLPVHTILSWPTQVSYIMALAENIKKEIDFAENGHTAIVYSAHSLPVSFIREGDPYVDHIKLTISAVEKITKQQGRLCYQSRSGPVEWLSPSTPDMIKELAKSGCKNILMVPISFVSDHVETLYEIDIEYMNLAQSLGIKLRRCESLNTQQLFIKALRELVLSQ